MKIVIDARESGTSTGRYIDKLLEYMHQLKPEHKIIVLTKKHRAEFVRGIAPDFKVIESNYKEFSFAEQLGLLRQIKNLKPDLAHFAMPQQPVLYSGRAVTTFHDLTTLRFSNPAKNTLVFKFKQKVYGRVITRAARKSAAILTISEFTKQDLIRYTGVPADKITVAYLAADKITEPPRLLPRLAGKEFIMYVGRPTPHKNLERLISAYEILKKDNPGLMLALAGKMDANYHRLEALVSRKRMADSIVFTGLVTEGELRWLYENTAAYVFPSLSEGFGLPGLEAMIHGAPVVSSNATCLPEIYGEAAEYFNPNNSKEMAKAIERVIGNSRRSGQLKILGAAQARKYSWRRMAKQTLDVYNQALNQP